MSGRGMKKLGFTCESCRRRKVKCGGEQPNCQRCIARSDECVYKHLPTLTYTARLEQRIKDLETELAATRVDEASKAPDSNGSPSLPLESPDYRIHISADLSSIDEPAKKVEDGPQAGVRSIKGIQVDGTGGITYHGITSFFQLPTELPVDLKSTGKSVLEVTQRRERLVANAWQQRILENYSDIPDPYKYLLEVHWCWVQPLFNFIYRPAFTRDLQTSGPYYSHTLMNALMSYSVRRGRSDARIRELLDKDHKGGVAFKQHTRRMACEELISDSDPIPITCSVPNVQALLMLSVQECSDGNNARAWITSGIAFRITDHLGVYVDGERYPSCVQLTDEDTEIRQRLFWSCFLWDKFVSLYLGRLPRLRYSSVSPPQLLLDDSSEIEPWTPFGIERDGDVWKYPQTPAYATTCFIQMCRLSVILSDILIRMYDPVGINTWSEMQQCLDTQEPKLREWWSNLPAHLKIDAENLPPYAPPSHIVTLNSLYHTLKILLYRPMLVRPSKEVQGDLQPLQHWLVECISSAGSITSIFDLFCRTFDIRHCILPLSYSVYIATSIFLLQVQTNAEDATACRRLEYGVRTLTQLQHIDPIICSGVDLITQQLTHLNVDITIDVPQSQDTVSPLLSTASDSQPAQPPPASIPGESYSIAHFPFADPVNSDDFNMDPVVFQNIFDVMSSIEPLDISVGAIQPL